MTVSQASGRAPRHVPGPGRSRRGVRRRVDVCRPGQATQKPTAPTTSVACPSPVVVTPPETTSQKWIARGPRPRRAAHRPDPHRTGIPGRVCRGSGRHQRPRHRGRGPDPPGGQGSPRPPGVPPRPRSPPQARARRPARHSRSRGRAQGRGRRVRRRAGRHQRPLRPRRGAGRQTASRRAARRLYCGRRKQVAEETKDKLRQEHIAFAAAHATEAPAPNRLEAGLIAAGPSSPRPKSCSTRRASARP